MKEARLCTGSLSDVVPVNTVVGREGSKVVGSLVPEGITVGAASPGDWMVVTP